MRDNITAILAHFGTTGTVIAKERGAFLIQTPHGQFQLVANCDQLDSIVRAHAFKESLAQAGFPHTDRYLTTIDGLPYAQFGADYYTLAHRPQGRPIEAAHATAEEITAATRTLASFHLAAATLTLDAPVAPTPPDTFRRGAEILAAAQKQIRKQKQRTDFEILLLTHAPQFIERIHQSIDLWQAARFTTWDNLPCHNRVKATHFLYAPQSTALTHFNAVGNNSHLHDLARLLQQFPAYHAVILESYNTVRPLPHGAFEALQALRHYPAPVIKIAEQYTTKKRGRMPAALEEKLRLCVK
ncbi:MAG: hypothetical protein FWC71_06360 [Defluviitaleaceae bacterium]|nr:hypothetical protein [Defluviitaleaceae bacterium]